MTTGVCWSRACSTRTLLQSSRHTEIKAASARIVQVIEKSSVFLASAPISTVRTQVLPYTTFTQQKSTMLSQKLPQMRATQKMMLVKTAVRSISQLWVDRDL